MVTCIHARLNRFSIQAKILELGYDERDAKNIRGEQRLEQRVFYPRPLTDRSQFPQSQALCWN